VLSGEEITPSLMVFHGFFDGESFTDAGDLYPLVPLIKQPRSILEIEENTLNKLFYEEFRLLVESRESVLM